MPKRLRCPVCGSALVTPTKGNRVGNTHDCLVCGADFTPGKIEEARQKEAIRLAASLCRVVAIYVPPVREREQIRNHLFDQAVRWFERYLQRRDAQQRIHWRGKKRSRRLR